EIGFGDGYGLHYLSPWAHQVTGVDIAPDNIPMAAVKYPAENLRFAQFDGMNFPFEKESFDVACSFQVIEHIPEPKLIEWLTGISDVLKKGGVFYVSTLNLATAMKPGAPYQKSVDHEKEFT